MTIRPECFKNLVRNKIANGELSLNLPVSATSDSSRATLACARLPSGSGAQRKSRERRVIRASPSRVHVNAYSPKTPQNDYLECELPTLSGSFKLKDQRLRLARPTGLEPVFPP